MAADCTSKADMPQPVRLAILCLEHIRWVQSSIVALPPGGEAVLLHTARAMNEQEALVYGRALDLLLTYLTGELQGASAAQGGPL